MTDSTKSPDEPTPPSANFQKKNSPKKIIIAISVAVLLALAVAAFFFLQSDDSESDSKNNVKQTTSSSTSSSTSTSSPELDSKANAAQLANDVNKNTDIDATVKFDENKNAYVISWVIPRPQGQEPETINDQSNAGRQAQLDAVSTLQAVKESSVVFENVRLDISAIRANGQGTDETVNMIKATYSSALIDKTDFTTIDEANIFAIGEDVDSNPDFDYYLYLDLTV